MDAGVVDGVAARQQLGIVAMREVGVEAQQGIVRRSIGGQEPK